MLLQVCLRASPVAYQRLAVQLAGAGIRVESNGMSRSCAGNPGGSGSVGNRPVIPHAGVRLIQYVGPWLRSRQSTFWIRIGPAQLQPRKAQHPEAGSPRGALRLPPPPPDTRVQRSGKVEPRAWSMASAGLSVSVSEASYPVGKEGHGDPELSCHRATLLCCCEGLHKAVRSPSSSPPFLLQLRSPLTSTPNHFQRFPTHPNTLRHHVFPPFRRGHPHRRQPHPPCPSPHRGR